MAADAFWVHRREAWELAASEVLAAERSSLLPLVPLMRGDRLDLARAAERLEAMMNETQRRELQLHFLVFGGLRHDVAELVGILE
ncbi:hypothetical protein J8C06_11625 [Chloracidobacterium validum]|uniref:Uncharacterized protein n=1 Tax=Chloracidobacterium validum TaxID=2821543 RepID=A0ABX8BH76_9BACT|nr:hypothetical protein [Chloracidobacterium validum]QUW04440.1 hypothetical protein J8C06_11625 [Chloracidobacterium validum]